MLVGMSITTSGRFMKQPFTVSCDDNTLYVGRSEEDNYTKIQDALDNASDGDTVFVYNGTYVENLIVDKSINLVGEDKNTTVIDGNKTGDVVNIVANQVIVSGFTICRGGRYGVHLDESGNIIIENIIRANRKGICCSASNDNNISGNSFFDNIEGIWLSNGNYNVISGNSFSLGMTWSVYVDVSDDNIITDNTINSTGRGAGGDGLYGEILFNGICHRNIIANNTLFNFNGTYRGGIHFYRELMGIGSHDNIIVGNSISSYDYPGIAIHCGFNNIVLGNTIRNNGWGVYLSRCWITNVSGNKLFNNNWGIALLSSRLNNIYQNIFKNNNKSATFGMLSIGNRWRDNYWDKPRMHPYPIIGRIGLHTPSWINFDWHPAQEPYDI